jgi:hypothetical protein
MKALNKTVSCRQYRTSSGFFFNLDVTQPRSADANRVFVAMFRASGKLENPHTKSNNSYIDFERKEGIYC